MKPGDLVKHAPYSEGIPPFMKTLYQDWGHPIPPDFGCGIVLEVEREFVSIFLPSHRGIVASWYKLDELEVINETR